MSDISSLDPKTLADQLAGFDVLGLQNALTKQANSLKAQQSALSALRTAMSDFRTALTGLNKLNNGMLKNQVTTSIDGVATVTANSSASKGSYNLFVQQLASSDQVAYDSLTDDAVKNASGKMSITIDGTTLDIDMDSLESLSDLTDAINSSDDNPGVTASLIRTDGNVSLMLSSDETGVKNKLNIDVSGLDSTTQGLFAKPDVISTARDAEYRLGESSKVYTSSSNTIDKLIDGVTIQLTKKQEPGDAPLHIDVNADNDATNEQVQSFVDAYNKLRGSLNSMTSSGGDGKDRGAFAGDSGIASLDRELNNMLRTSFGGKDITAYGITADKDGNLTVDSEKLNDALKEDPDGLTRLFNGNDGLIKSMDKSMDKYLSSTNGMLKSRQDSLDRQQADIDDKTDKINARYKTSYDRYLKQFTQLQSIMAQMNNTKSMFGIE